MINYINIFKSIVLLLVFFFAINNSLFSQNIDTIKLIVSFKENIDSIDAIIKTEEKRGKHINIVYAQIPSLIKDIKAFTLPDFTCLREKKIKVDMFYNAKQRFINYFNKESNPFSGSDPYELYEQIRNELLKQLTEILSLVKNEEFKSNISKDLEGIKEDIKKLLSKQSNLTKSIFSIKFLFNDRDTISENELRISLLKKSQKYKSIYLGIEGIFSTGQPQNHIGIGGTIAWNLQPFIKKQTRANF